MTGKCLRFMELLKWMGGLNIAEMDGTGWKMMKMVGNCWKWMEWPDIPGNG